jgi:DNA-directed RNA polymerase subunit alpha
MSSDETTVDVWSWYGKSIKDLDLDAMVALKRHVLAERATRSALDLRISAELDATQEPGKAGIAHWLRGDFGRARDLLADDHPGDTASYAFAECVLYGGLVGRGDRPYRPSEAVEALKGIGGNTAMSMRLRALVADDQREEFAAVLEKADQAFLDSPDGLYFRGLALEHEGDCDGAEELYEKGLAIDSKHVDCLFRKAYRRDLSSEDAEAIAIYEGIAEQEPTHINALINLGVLYEDQERYRDALYCYRRVLAAHPRHPRALLFAKDAEASLDMYYDEEQEVRQDKKNQILKIPVSDFELSVRSRNCLAKMNIVTLGDLVQKSEPELLTYKNFGETSLNEIKQILESKGLRLGMRPEDELQPVSQRSGNTTTTAAPNLALDPNDKRLQIPATDLALSVRSRKCLANLNIKVIGELVQYTADELLAQRNFGVTSLREISEQLEGMGLTLRTVDR